MHRRIRLFLILPVLFLGAALWSVFHSAAQNAADTPPLFIPVADIGSARPAGIRFDPARDQFAWVDKAGRLILVDAETFQTTRVIYENGAYESFVFSRDGRSLAVAIGTRVEVWDTESGVMVATITPPGANRLQAPMQFTRSDELLLFTSVVPAPQELRRSENDTTILPWIWDVAAARNLRRSVLPNGTDAYPFYNIRTPMVAADNGVLVAGLDNRIFVYDADTPDLTLIADLPVTRLETDPIITYRSATDPLLYISLSNSGAMLQVNTETNATRQFNLGYDLGARGYDTVRELQFSRMYQILGAGEDQPRGSALDLLLFGDADRAQSTTALLDILVPLTEDPLLSPAGGTALLVYDYNADYRAGAIDLLRPYDAGAIALHPDGGELAIRRVSGQQPVELYDLETGALRTLFVPSEQDSESRRTFGYTDDGAALVIDFERYDARTGERLARLPQFTQPFGDFYFDEQGDVITFGGTPINGSDFVGFTPWRVWDSETGQLLRESTFPVSGDILRQSADRLRYLFRVEDGVAIADLSGAEITRYHFDSDLLPQGAQIIPNADWTRFALWNGSALDVFTREGELLYRDTGGNLLSGADSVFWQDDRTLRFSGGGGISTPTITGIAYHSSGLPQCVVDTVENWQSLVRLWELVRLNNAQSSLDALSARICTALTGEGETVAGATPISPDPTAVAALLTATPDTYYISGRTPAPIAVPGVPTCITRFYQRDAITYADLWREITAGVTDEATLAELETMICEGLLYDIGGIQPTATINPDTLVVATATPAEAVAETTGGDEYRFNILTLDVETGARQFAASVYLPPDAQPIINAADLLGSRFNTQFGRFPDGLRLSADQSLVAVRNVEGFITVYRLATPYQTVLADEQAARAGRAAAQEVRSLSLLPTPTATPQPLGDILPTITPTITQTPVPIAGAQADAEAYRAIFPRLGDEEIVCPYTLADTLPTLANAPADFTPPGTLLVYPLVTERGDDVRTWTLNPRTGELVASETLPPCATGNCNYSPDGAWVLLENWDSTDDGLPNPGDVVVMRADGGDLQLVYPAADVQALNPYFTWRAPHTLEIRYSGYREGGETAAGGTATPLPYTVDLIRTFDPETGNRTDPAQPTAQPTFGILPFNVINQQPGGTLQVIYEQFPGGNRYYLRDVATGESTLFGQNIDSPNWLPDGSRFIYGAYDERIQAYTTFIYDVEIGQHVRLPADTSIGFGGTWSHDNTRIARSGSLEYGEHQQRLSNGEPPLHLQVWDSTTGLLRRYCLPDFGATSPDLSLTWSPDSRYLAFVADVPLDADLPPTPTFAISPEAPPPGATAVPLEVQYQQQFPHTLILDTETGAVVSISTQVGGLVRWLGE